MIDKALIPKIQELAAKGVKSTDICIQLGLKIKDEKNQNSADYSQVNYYAKKVRKYNLATQRKLSSEAEKLSQEAKLIAGVKDLCIDMTNWVNKLDKQYDDLSLDELRKMRVEIEELRKKQESDLIVTTSRKELRRRQEEYEKTLDLRMKAEANMRGDMRDLRHEINLAYKNFVELLKTPAISQNVEIKNWLQQIGIGAHVREPTNPITA